MNEAVQTTDSPDGELHSPPPAELVHALRFASRALQTFLTARARASGLGLLEFLILIRAAEGDGVTPLEAGRSLGLRSSTMTGLSDRLEQDKLIRRRPHPTDRRLLLLKATPRGRRVLERALAPLLVGLEELAGGHEVEQRALLGSFIEQVGALVLQAAGAARSRPSRRPAARASVPRRPPPAAHPPIRVAGNDAATR